MGYYLQRRQNQAAAMSCFLALRVRSEVAAHPIKLIGVFALARWGSSACSGSDSHRYAIYQEGLFCRLFGLPGPRLPTLTHSCMTFTTYLAC